MIDRRNFLAGSAALGGGWMLARSAAPASGDAAPLTPPARGHIPVAFAISAGATVIDFCGPWEVFQDVMVPERGPSHDEQMPFRLFTVADAPASVRVTGGMQLVPDHTVDDAPQPRVIVVPAMRASEKMLEWLRRASPGADVLMSVCTGAFTVAKAGLLKGQAATTHHDFYESFAQRFPEVTLVRGRRFVENGKVATAGGLTAGIDLALRVVERYFGRPVALRTAEFMEYEGRSWVV
jgi:transcriptional regulator GlxA family with amidase domain